jgi:predicted dienelactone hydrolase
VGFQTLAEFDAGRTWQSTRDYLGRFSADPRGRPVLVNVWYPAESHSRKVGATLNAYLHQSAPPGFETVAAALTAREVQNVENSVSDAQRPALRALPVHARADLPFARGRYPVVLYFGGLNADINANFLLAEFLASHGYVVASISLIGPSDRSLSQSRDPEGLELAVRDMEFALGMLSRRTSADRTRVVAMGHSVGAVEALVFANRNQNVVAAVGLDGTYGFDGAAHLLLNARGFTPQTLRAPLLDLRRAQGEQEARLDPKAVASLRHATRTVVTLPHAHHSDFTAFAMLAEKFSVATQPKYANTGWDRSTGRRAYEAMCAIVLAFLDEHTGQHADTATRFSAAVARGSGEVRTLAALPPPLSPDESVALAAQGADEPKKWFVACAGDEAVASCVDAQRFNTAGYERLTLNQPRDAFTLFDIVTWAHPNSANAQDSLADALMALGQKDRAHTALLRSIDLAASDPALADSERASFIAAARSRLTQ